MCFSKNAGVWLVCFFVFVAFVQTGSTHTATEVDVKCPLCHTQFKSKTDVSGTRLGMRLDLKPVGPIAAPWSVPKCPNCHFIVFSNELKDNDKKELLKLINSDKYRHIAQDNSTYFLLAKIYETIGMDNLEVAHAYLKASWQVENDGKKYPKYLEASYSKFAAFLSSNKGNSSSYMQAELVSGEIERRLGKFDVALSRFTRLQKQPEFARANRLAAIIDFQIELINSKDSGPHEIKI